SARIILGNLVAVEHHQQVAAVDADVPGFDLVYLALRTAEYLGHLELGDLCRFPQGLELRAKLPAGDGRAAWPGHIRLLGRDHGQCSPSAPMGNSDFKGTG